MSTRIHAGEHTVGELFAGERAFRMPSYQRPYAWTAKEAEELLDDLLEAQAGGADVKRLAPYFLGGIVLVRTEGVQEVDVIDGQQRLTTLTILLAVLRNLEDDPREMQTLDQMVRRAGSRVSGAEDRYHVTLRDRDREFFRREVQDTDPRPLDGRTLSDARRCLVGNRDLFRRRLAKLGADGRARLAGYLVQRCFLVTVETAERDSAYRIFAVMNTRGLELSATDILKAHVVGGIEPDRQGAYTTRWEELEERVGRTAFLDLFGHLRTLHRRRRLEGTLEEEFRKHVLDGRSTDAFVDEELVPSVEAMRTIREARWPDAAEAGRTDESREIERRLRALALLDNADWEPAALLYRTHRATSAVEYRTFLEGLDALAWSLFVRRVSLNARFNRYALVLRGIDNGDDLSRPGLLGLDERERRETFEKLDGPIYPVKATCRAILLRLDEALSDGTASYDVPKTEIEHVLPQKPKAGGPWPEAFPDETVREAWTDRLANLVLLSGYKNKSAANHPFERKKSSYFLKKGRSPFVLTNEVADEPNWTPEVLERRQARLLGALAGLWNLGERDGASH